MSPRVLQIAFGWRGEDGLILLDVEEMRHYMDQAGAALFGIDRVRRYVESAGGGGNGLAAAILKMAAADPHPEHNGNQPVPTDT